MGVLDLLHGVLCSAALAISGYALYVELAKEKDENFEALCDLSPQISCSAVLTSKYSRGLGLIGDLLGDDHPLNLQNCVYGIVYYSLIALLGRWRRRTLQLRIMISSELLGVLAFIYLGYIMLYILNDLCLVCLSLYVVHVLLLALHTYQWYQYKKKKDL